MQPIKLGALAPLTWRDPARPRCLYRAFDDVPEAVDAPAEVAAEGLERQLAAELCHARNAIALYALTTR